MEGAVILLVLFVLWLLIAPIVALVKAGDANRRSAMDRDQLKTMLERLRALEIELRALKNGGQAPPPQLAETPAAGE